MPSLALPPLPPLPAASQIQALQEDLNRTAPGLKLLSDPSDLERFSSDFHGYSPVLLQLLAGCRGQLVALPANVEEVMAVAATEMSLALQTQEGAVEEALVTQQVLAQAALG